jgi:ATP-binding cassette subfamily B protein
LREILFSKVTESAVRQLALKVFRHLHALSLRFHLDRQTGGMSRDIERGTRGIQQLISYSLYSILPTLVEIGLVLGFFVVKYDVYYAIVTGVALAAYIVFTIKVTEWRTHFRRTMNELDSRANSRAIDSLLNYETVKYFGNEEWEAERYDENLKRYRAAAIKSQNSLSFLNFGQQAIIGAGLVLILWRATQGVMAGRLTLGDLVLINTFMLQLYIPLNFLGVVYRELKQSLTDMDRMFTLLGAAREVPDVPGAPALTVAGGEVRFAHVGFAYEAARTILFDVSFTIPAGTTTAVVGHSGSGKSTLARLLFRFYDLDRTSGGAITIDGQDIRDVTQDSLRASIGIVPQDTVLFNDTIYYNIAYGRPSASRDEVIAAARAAHIHDFIEGLPKGYDTPVGERGLKLSGGEKQRVAIARTVLKNPPILLFDEATSALDSRSERAIQHELDQIARERTTLVIAHRLSTVVHAQQIIVLDRGRIVERGTHAELLRAGGLFAQMWALQQRSAVRGEASEERVTLDGSAK